MSGRRGMTSARAEVRRPLLGGATGLSLATAAIRILGRYLSADLPRIFALSIDLRVLAFTALISLPTGILFGLAPLFQARRRNANDTLKRSARWVGGCKRGCGTVLLSPDCDRVGPSHRATDLHKS